MGSRIHFLFISVRAALTDIYDFCVLRIASGGETFQRPVFSPGPSLIVIRYDLRVFHLDNYRFLFWLALRASISTAFSPLTPPIRFRSVTPSPRPLLRASSGSLLLFSMPMVVPPALVLARLTTNSLWYSLTLPGKPFHLPNPESFFPLSPSLFFSRLSFF